jgi:hypothetical protein
VVGCCIGKKCVWLSDGVPLTDICGCSAAALLLRSWNHKARAPMTRLGRPTPSPVASAMISDLLNPSSSFFSSLPGAVVDVGASPAAAVALETPELLVLAGLAVEAATSGVVIAVVAAG